jgi:hypothetical protein
MVAGVITPWCKPAKKCSDRHEGIAHWDGLYSNPNVSGRTWQRKSIVQSSVMKQSNMKNGGAACQFMIP